MVQRTLRHRILQRNFVIVGNFRDDVCESMSVICSIVELFLHKGQISQPGTAGSLPYANITNWTEAYHI